MAETLAANAIRGGARRQIGGVVGGDPLAAARLARALGPGASLLRVGGLVAEWDACALARDPLETDGAFAAAWVDEGGVLHLARDAVGERSLFYSVRGGVTVFASTVRALLAARIERPSLNISAVPAYLCYGYVPGRATLAEGVYEVLPGEHVTIDSGVVRRAPFRRLPAEDAVPRGDDAYCAALRVAVERAVARRLPDGPAAVTLSGGIDSSVVLAVAASFRHGPLTAYSLAFGKRMPNELRFAALAAERARVRHEVVELTPRIVMNRFDDVLGVLSTPIGEPLTVANTLLFERIAPFAPVVLNGEGGDPCFGGPKNVPMLLRDLYGPPNGADTYRHRERAYLATHRKCFDDVHRMLAPGLADLRAVEEALTPHFADPRWPTLVNRLTALNITFKGAHHILPKVDHLSRAAGVLGRSPLFDRAVVELATRMPAHLKLDAGVEKIALKRAFADLVPREVVDRPKSGMRVPVEAWLGGRYERWARERILDGLAPHGLVERGYLEELLRPRGAPMPRRGAKVWLLLSLEAWLRTVLG